MEKETAIEKLLDKLSRSSFRSRFHLSSNDKSLINEKGLDAIRASGKDLLLTRIVPALPKNDGRQTPYRGYPIFVAQHATATCCRNCLYKWHKIEKGKKIDKKELEYILDVLQGWISREFNYPTNRSSLSR